MVDCELESQGVCSVPCGRGVMLEEYRCDILSTTDDRELASDFLIPNCKVLCCCEPCPRGELWEYHVTLLRKLGNNLKDIKNIYIIASYLSQDCNQ